MTTPKKQLHIYSDAECVLKQYKMPDYPPMPTIGEYYNGNTHDKGMRDYGTAVAKWHEACSEMDKQAKQTAVKFADQIQVEFELAACKQLSSRECIKPNTIYTIEGYEVNTEYRATEGTCNSSCGPSDFYPEGKCGKNGCCIEVATLKRIEEGAESSDGWISVEKDLPPITNEWKESDYVLTINMDLGQETTITMAWYSYNLKEWKASHPAFSQSYIMVTHWRKNTFKNPPKQ